jgi:cytochrome c oxidase cbb3-type subunit 2
MMTRKSTVIALAILALGLLGRIGHAQSSPESAPIEPPVAVAPAQPTTPAPRSDHTDYDRYCSWCHGPLGNGYGTSARFLFPWPRDLVSAAFRCRTTPSGSLPTDEDLRRTLRMGVPGTAMPAWPTLAPHQVDDLIATIKDFSPRWRTEKPAAPIVVPPEPAPDAGSVLRGAQIYARQQCASCHGPTGKGDGPAAATLRDDLGNPIRPADFTARGMMKCGDSAARIYTTFMTGLNGTPMPSFDGTVTASEAWDLVHFVQSLRR